MVGANLRDRLKATEREHHFPLGRHKDPIQDTPDGVRLFIRPREPSPNAGYLTECQVRNAIVEHLHPGKVHAVIILLIRKVEEVEVIRKY